MARGVADAPENEKQKTNDEKIVLRFPPPRLAECWSLSLLTTDRSADGTIDVTGAEADSAWHVSFLGKISVKGRPLMKCAARHVGREMPLVVEVLPSSG